MPTAVARSLRNKSSQTTDKGLERAGKILDAARDLVVQEGYGRLSMRAVAASSGITLGTLQHYFPTREALIEATLQHLLEGLQVQADRMATESSQASATGQFRAAMRYFVTFVRSPSGQATFVELKALSLRDAFAAKVMERVLSRARKSVGRRVQGVAPGLRPAQVDERAGLILGQLMGMVFLSRSGELDDAVLNEMLATARGA